jgi:hypothetical protein
MIRTACLFGLWTILCMVATIAAFYVTADIIDGERNILSLDNPTWGAVGFFAAFSPIAGAVAALLWALFHRGGGQPGWLGYALLALLVVGVSHMLVFGVIAGWGSPNPLRDILGAIFMFVIHGWLSMPVAFVGPALFVLWKRRRASA